MKSLYNGYEEENNNENSRNYNRLKSTDNFIFNRNIESDIRTSIKEITEDSKDNSFKLNISSNSNVNENKENNFSEKESIQEMPEYNTQDYAKDNNGIKTEEAEMDSVNINSNYESLSPDVRKALEMAAQLNNENNKEYEMGY